MHISLNWLLDFVDIPLMNQPHLYEIIVGEVLSVEKHPDADKLNIAQVNLGYTTSTIVCGANNLEAGQKVAVARPGVVLPGDFKIGSRSIRGIESNGMICSEDELGLTQERQPGIMVLDETLKPGTPLSKVLNISGYSPKQLGDLLTAHTAEVETVEKKGDDYIIEIDNKSLTHRPDLWGHYGIAREFSAILNLKLKPYAPKAPKSSLSEKLEVNCTSKELCHYFTAVIAKNITISESPDWLKKRLENVGINPVNNIVDITNYIMLEIGQPMHAYDRQLVKSDKLSIQPAKPGQEFIALNQSPYDLNENDIVITNQETDGALMLAGVMGGANSEINQTTKEIIIESACWPATTIRKTATRHNLRTDASQRFEKALDPKLAKVALTRSLELLKEVQPDAQIVSNIAEFGKAEAPDINIQLNFDRVNTYLGLNLSKEQMLGLLEKLEFEVVTLEDNFAEIKVPSFRATKDVQIEVDLIEEIGRLHGYHNLPDKTPSTPLKSPETNPSRSLKHELRELLSGLGLTEVLNYSFYSETDFKNALLSEEKHVKVKNYLAETQTHMRASLVPNFLKAIAENFKHNNELSFYEIGRSYTKTADFFPVEQKHLLLSLAHKKGDQTDLFFELKGIVESLLSHLQLDYEIRTSKEPYNYAHPHQCAEINVNNISIGQIFSIHPLVKENFNLRKNPIVIAELNLGALLNHRQQQQFKELPKFPDMEFDISALLPETVTVKQAETSIREANKSLIHNVELFDIYRGDKLKKDHKSLAFHITLRDLERTLTDEDLKTVMEIVIKNLESIGGEVRK